MKEIKVSSCVDCAVSIIGDLPRCPACHARHAAIPSRGCIARLPVWQTLVVWLLTVLLIVGAMELLSFAGRLFQ